MIKLYLDEDVHPNLSSALCARGYDVVSAHEIERRGFSDAAQLEFAAQAGRTLVSFNATDYIKLHNAYWEEKKVHAGIILSKQVPLKVLIRRFGLFLQQHTAEDLQGQLFWLQIPRDVSASNINGS